MRDRVHVLSAGPWEPIIGYSRAIRIGNRVVVAGTTAIQDQGVVGEGDTYKQSVYVLKIIEKALASVGAQMSDVIVTRIFVTDMSQKEGVVKAHREVFQDVRPVTTIVEVKALIDPRLLVEMEVEAVLCE
ncbi:RidA family protein [Alicyclobacillus fastidiosus]|uniref:RidA family protein n=1 Tax=Alicyclobacillus fastidiosus TaxID=392011 RepID=A0ABV5AL83_9BACL|nr:RidA family protein [Alicyclobacillus fastidiosus]WEH08225.1 RidA family protein [Alicyclobacillus fastidiosus]